MALNSEIFLARAEECERDVGNSTLANVRDQLMRSAEAWRTKGETALASERLQAKAKNKSMCDLEHVDMTELT